jgi:hypothetical protein
MSVHNNNLNKLTDSEGDILTLERDILIKSNFNNNKHSRTNTEPVNLDYIKTNLLKENRELKDRELKDFKDLKDLKDETKTKDFLDKETKEKETKEKETKDKEKEIKEKLKQNKTYTGPWNYGVMLLLKRVGDNANGFKWMHSVEQQKCEDKYDTYATVEIILLSLTSCLTGSEFIGLMASSEIQDTKITLIIITGLQIILGLIYTIVRSLKESGDLKTTSATHKYLHTKYSRLNFDIQEQFTLDVKDRIVDRDFIRIITRSFNDLLESGISISKDTMREYIDAFNNKEINTPMMIGSLDQIEIVVEQGNISIKKEKDNNLNNTSVHEGGEYDNKHKYELERFLRRF